ncbi:hypothetical protein [Pallidibacillus pasinlerensis]|uniref:NAD(P)-dependent oxidoreductase n=1 Tax=Pallidibacillus pasinlerensis TaxID=2703818 RepID=A0ABX0A189_9BACI|nr:hypothetical protein [Pallidibacillus pasinlerensis]NCU16592.1 hypothetical protein [Pallidibacillus pasinlerensis]
MERFIIFGADGFLGFELCKQLLNAGNEVMHMPITDDPFPEEKLLFIGRNSNFTIIGKDQDLNILTPIHLIIPCYDWSNDFKDHINYTQNIIEKLQSNITHLTYLLHDSIELDPFLNKINVSKITKVYFPYLYSANIPKNTLFYNLLTEENIQRNEQILNVTDAVAETLNIIASEKSGTFVIKNKNVYRWQECLFWLTGIKSQIKPANDNQVVKGIGREVVENQEHAIFPKNLRKIVENNLQNV